MDYRITYNYHGDIRIYRGDDMGNRGQVIPKIKEVEMYILLGV